MTKRAALQKPPFFCAESAAKKPENALAPTKNGQLTKYPADGIFEKIVLFLLSLSAFPGLLTCPAEHSRQKGTLLRRGEPGVHIVYGLCNA